MPAFIKAPLFLSSPSLSSRHLYLLRTKAKVNPIFKRGRKPTENNKNNKNNKEIKPIFKYKCKLIKIKICFYRGTIISISFITFFNLIFFIVIEVFFLIFILFLFFRRPFYPFGSLFIYYIIVSALFVIKYIVTGAFGFVLFFFRRFNLFIVFIAAIILLILLLLIAVIVFKRGFSIHKYNKTIFKTGYKYVFVPVFSGVLNKEKYFGKNKYN